jgi:hypothetical protein
MHISRLELLYKDGPLNLLLLFLKYLFRIWDWGLTNSFCDHVIQISITDELSINIYPTRKNLNIVETVILYLSNAYFPGTVLYVQYALLYLILTRPKLILWLDITVEFFLMYNNKLFFKHANTVKVQILTANIFVTASHC